MGYDPQTPFPSGTQFTYTANIIGGFFSSPQDIVNSVASALSQDGIQVLSNSINTGAITDALLAAASGSTNFTVVLQCLDNNSNDVLLDAQQYCDYEFEAQTGAAPSSSSITSYTLPAGAAISTGLAGQATPGSSSSILPAFNLTGGQEALIAIVVIVVVLIVAVILLPENAGRAFKAFT